MNEEYTPFEEWFETYERDGGELMLYNTIDLEAAYLAGAKAALEKAAGVADNEANGFRNTRIAAAIRKIGVK